MFFLLQGRTVEFKRDKSKKKRQKAFFCSKFDVNDFVVSSQMISSVNIVAKRNAKITCFWVGGLRSAPC